MSVTGAVDTESLTRLVQDALAHVFDPVVLQTHPLAAVLERRPAGRIGPTGPERYEHAGRALRSRLLEAIASLRPERTAQYRWGDDRAARGYHLLQRRYVEGEAAPAVQAALNIGRSQYYREHERAIAAVASVLAPLVTVGPAPTSATTAGASDADGASQGVAEGSPRPLAPPSPFQRSTEVHAAPGGRVPQPLTSFVGRAQVLAGLRRALGAARLVTLTGPAGTGKTRTALQLAAEVAAEFPDGVVFVPLASLVDPARVLPAVAQALGLQEAPAESLLADVQDVLRHRRLLLLLDNFEQVGAAAPLVTALLAACPALHVVATSRAALRIYGEQEFPVPPLDLPCVPEAGRPPPLDTLAQVEAVALFLDRASRSAPNFTITAQNAPALAALCRRLEGLPLAIELAAARVKMLPPAAMLQRLAGQDGQAGQPLLGLLVGGAQDLPARQQTLRGAIAWSYDLLTEGERRDFCRLGTFVGGWTLDAAHAVVGRWPDEEPAPGGGAPPAEALVPFPRGEILERVASLMDQSLLRQDDPVGGEPRFWMLEMVREFALEQLALRGEQETARRRHAAYFLALAEQAAAQLNGLKMETWLDTLEQEGDNFRAALSWGLERRQAEYALRLCAALAPFWEVRGYFREGLDWLEKALALPDATDASPTTRAHALGAAGHLGRASGAYRSAEAWFDEGLVAAQAAGDPRLIASAQHNLGIAARGRQEYARAEQLLQEALRLRRDLGDERDAANTLGMLAILARDQCDNERAAALAAESLRIARLVGNHRDVALALHNLGTIWFARGEHARAEAMHAEALAINEVTGDRRGVAVCYRTLCTEAAARNDLSLAGEWAMQGLEACLPLRERWNAAECLAALALVCVRHGHAERAAVLGGAAEALRTAAGGRALPSPHLELEAVAQAARTHLGDAAYQARWVQGQVMSFEQAIAYGLDVASWLTAVQPAA